MAHLITITPVWLKLDHQYNWVLVQEDLVTPASPNCFATAAALVTYCNGQKLVVQNKQMLTPEWAGKLKF